VRPLTRRRPLVRGGLAGLVIVGLTLAVAARVQNRRKGMRRHSGRVSNGTLRRVYGPPAPTPTTPEPEPGLALPIATGDPVRSIEPEAGLALPIAIGDPVRAIEPAAALERSVRGLLVSAPEMSAYRTLSRRQAVAFFALVVAFAVGLALDPIRALVAFNGIVTAVYLVALAYNVRIFRALLRKPPIVVVTDEEASGVPDDQLPSYTVLVAAYHESEIIEDTIRALEALDYPRDRLDVLLLLEADDSETIHAAIAARPASNIRIVAVPHAPPRTKPKACNYGLHLSSGALVTIFDAEDRPDQLQLRRAAAAFARLPPPVACLQALLQYHNERQNLITKWFSAEYVTWFASVLPALVQLKAPLPLGGTSMHVRREVLEGVGAWDPFNVTEDADLGIRLQRYGYRTLVLDSVTFEEANSDFINWVKQRSRWYKGYLQTWLVHMRQPRRLWRELGPAGFLGFQVLIGTTPLLALLNPLFWLLTALWFLSGAPIVQVLFPAFVFYPALVSVVFGNFLALYRTMVSVRLADHPGLVISALLMPIYWVFMSIAAMRAFLQLFVAPSFWEKTMHGLDRTAEASSLGSSR
jgi:cellulose synthase/poly-beta-1,6-N-acetylglucosamine synthase-like glycosyltransferase